MFRLFILFFWCTFLFSCADTSHEEYIFNNWILVQQSGEGALTEDQISIDAVSFQLRDDYTYTYNSMGIYEESGRFNVESSRIYTFPEDDQPRYFSIEKLTADSLILLMQIEGRDMIWKFVPEK